MSAARHGAGRKRKPRALHLVHGTLRPCRDNKSAPQPANEAPQCPAWLSPRGHELFGFFTARIQAMGYASASHTEALALLARTQEDLEILSGIVTSEGYTYVSAQAIKDKDGNTVLMKLKKGNPAVAMMRDAARHLQSLLSEFGLTPASAGKISVPEGGSKTSDDWADLASS